MDEFEKAMLFYPCDLETELKKLYISLHNEFGEFENDTFRMITGWSTDPRFHD